MGDAQSSEKRRGYGKAIIDLHVRVKQAFSLEAVQWLGEEFEQLQKDFARDLKDGRLQGDDDMIAALLAAIKNIADALDDAADRAIAILQQASASPELPPIIIQSGNEQQAEKRRDTEDEDEVKLPSQPVSASEPDTLIEWKYTQGAFDGSIGYCTRKKYPAGKLPNEGQTQYAATATPPSEGSPEWKSIEDFPDLLSAIQKSNELGKDQAFWQRARTYAQAIKSKDYSKIIKYLWKSLKTSDAAHMSVNSNRAVTECAAFLMSGGKAKLKEVLASYSWDLDDALVLEAVANAIQDVVSGGARTGVTGYSGQMDNVIDETDFSKMPDAKK